MMTIAAFITAVGASFWLGRISMTKTLAKAVEAERHEATRRVMNAKVMAFISARRSLARLNEKQRQHEPANH